VPSSTRAASPNCRLASVPRAFASESLSCTGGSGPGGG
jgi:hypothetical protein